MVQDQSMKFQAPFISLLPKPLTVLEKVLNELVKEWITTLSRKHGRGKVGVTLVLVSTISLITLLLCGNYSPSNSETLLAICTNESDKKCQKKYVEKMKNVLVTLKLIKTCFNHTDAVSLRMFLFKLMEASASCLKNTFITMKHVLFACCILLSHLINECKNTEHLFELIKLCIYINRTSQNKYWSS